MSVPDIGVETMRRERRRKEKAHRLRTSKRCTPTGAQSGRVFTTNFPVFPSIPLRFATWNWIERPPPSSAGAGFDAEKTEEATIVDPIIMSRRDTASKFASSVLEYWTTFLVNGFVFAVVGGAVKALPVWPCKMRTVVGRSRRSGWNMAIYQCRDI